MELTAVNFFDLVREDLQAVEARMRAALPERPAPLGAAVEQLFKAGGKRLRPTLALLAARLCRSDLEPTIALAAAVEMLHTATLVHDDLVDGALLRRGAPTLNAQWSPAATVLAGDYLFARAAELAAQTNSMRVVSRFASVLEIIVGGELRQLFASRNREAVSRAVYFERIYAKTAVLFAVAAEAAAWLGAADDAACAALQTFGRQTGLAFQIVDDILDFTGDERQLGKPAGSDLRQGIVTLPALCYLESHAHDSHFQALLNGRAGDPTLVRRVVKAVRDSGAIDAARAEAQACVAQAQTALLTLPDNVYRRALHDLADYVVRRDV